METVLLQITEVQRQVAFLVHLNTILLVVGLGVSVTGLTCILYTTRGIAQIVRDTLRELPPPR